MVSNYLGLLKSKTINKSAKASPISSAKRLQPESNITNFKVRFKFLWKI